MARSGTLQSASSVVGAADGDAAWSNPSNAVGLPDAVYAEILSLGAGQVSETLQLTLGADMSGVAHPDRLCGLRVVVYGIAQPVSTDNITFRFTDVSFAPLGGGVGVKSVSWTGGGGDVAFGGSGDMWDIPANDADLLDAIANEEFFATLSVASVGGSQLALDGVGLQLFFRGGAAVKIAAGII